MELRFQKIMKTELARKVDEKQITVTSRLMQKLDKKLENDSGGTHLFMHQTISMK